MSDSCFICGKHKGTIHTAGKMIYEDEYVYIGHIDKGDSPAYLGYCMIDLKRHVPTLADMNMEEAKAFGMAMARISRALKESEGAEHIYARVSGHGVPHLHMHLTPRYPGTPQEYWGPWEVLDWQDAPYGKGVQVDTVCERLKVHMEANHASGDE